MKYMKDFFIDCVGDWQNLIPRFEDENGLLINELVLERASESYAAVASNTNNSEIVIYFYNFTDTSIGEIANSTEGTTTGKLYNLSRNTTYKYKWFNPLDGTYSSESTISIGRYSTSLTLPEKTASTDYVLYLYK